MFRMISGQICFCFLHSIEWRYSFERVTVVNETRFRPFGFLGFCQKPKNQKPKYPEILGRYLFLTQKRERILLKAPILLEIKYFYLFFMMILGFLTGWNSGYHNYGGKGDDWIRKSGRSWLCAQTVTVTT